MRIVVTLSIALAGCYSPSVAPCVYSCNGTSCPSGLTCNAATMCVENQGDTCEDVESDAAVDRDAGTTTCGWPRISNIDPCASSLQMYLQIDEWIASGTVDTDDLSTWSTQTGVHPVDVSSNSNQRAVVAAVKSFRIDAASGLTVTGSRPLIIIASDAVAITGQLRFDGAESLTCGGVSLAGAGVGAIGMAAAGGGGGGGFGGTGGSGGAGRQDNSIAVGGPGGPGGVVMGEETNSPLLVGCPGGDGGGLGKSGPGGLGGFGGGAIQISTKGSFSLKGTITANGAGGGKAGVARSAAGGGGSGGAILLEAPMIFATGTARLCANGGGGGGDTMNGESVALCAAAAGGVGGDINGGAGGAGVGATQNGSLGGTSLAKTTPGLAGGGGGGGAGRIRINGLADGLSTVSPKQSLGSFPIP